MRVDVGGTTTAAAAVERDGTVGKILSVPTCAVDDPEAVLGLIIDRVQARAPDHRLWVWAGRDHLLRPWSGPHGRRDLSRLARHGGARRAEPGAGPAGAHQLATGETSVLTTPEALRPADGGESCTVTLETGRRPGAAPGDGDSQRPRAIDNPSTIQTWATKSQGEDAGRVGRARFSLSVTGIRAARSRGWGLVPRYVREVDVGVAGARSSAPQPDRVELTSALSSIQPLGRTLLHRRRCSSCSAGTVAG